MAKLRCKYEYSKPWGKPVHTWSVVGARCGLHLSISDYGEDRIPVDRYGGGLEIHWRAPPRSMADEAPSHDRCWLLGCPCWHDGSSLIVSEHWIPLWLTAPQDHDRMFDLLCAELDQQEIAEDDHGEA